VLFFGSAADSDPPRVVARGRARDELLRELAPLDPLDARFLPPVRLDDERSLEDDERAPLDEVRLSGEDDVRVPRDRRVVEEPEDARVPRVAEEPEDARVPLDDARVPLDARLPGEPDEPRDRLDDARDPSDALAPFEEGRLRAFVLLDVPRAVPAAMTTS
jgi:hypothetical protein